MSDLRIVKCPRCGLDKWKYLGGDLDYEPDCAVCKDNDRSAGVSYKETEQ